MQIVLRWQFILAVSVFFLKIRASRFLYAHQEIKVVDMNAQISDIVKETNELRRTVAFQERKSHDAMKKV